MMGGNPAPTMNQQPVMPAGQMQMPAPNPGMTPAGPMPAAAPLPPAPSGKKSSVVETVILVIVCLIAAVAIVAAVMLYMQWDDLKTNFDAKVGLETAAAEKAAGDKYAEQLQEELKRETVQYTGPDDYGRISFSYPKMWSVYEAQDGTKNSDYEAYFAPAPIHSLEDETARYAIRFKIVNQLYNDVAEEYANDLEDSEGAPAKGIFSADNSRISGVRYDGQIADGIDGTVVIAKINDKTMIIQSDSKVYSDSFEKVLSTLRRGN